MSERILKLVLAGYELNMTQSVIDGSKLELVVTKDGELEYRIAGLDTEVELSEAILDLYTRVFYPEMLEDSE